MSPAVCDQSNIRRLSCGTLAVFPAWCLGAAVVICRAVQLMDVASDSLQWLESFVDRLWLNASVCTMSDTAVKNQLLCDQAKEAAAWRTSKITSGSPRWTVTRPVFTCLLVCLLAYLHGITVAGFCCTQDFQGRDMGCMMCVLTCTLAHG